MLKLEIEILFGSKNEIYVLYLAMIKLVSMYFGPYMWLRLQDLDKFVCDV